MSVHIVKRQNRLGFPVTPEPTALRTARSGSVRNQAVVAWISSKHTSVASPPSCIPPNSYGSKLQRQCCANYSSTFPVKTVITSRERQRRPGVGRPLPCTAAAVRGLVMWALWVNACQTFAFSKKTHPQKKRGVGFGVRGGVFMRD